VSTSGLAWKISGKIGDSPIIRAGSYFDNRAGVAVATSIGEEIIRIADCFLIVVLMRGGMHPQKACEEALKRIIKSNNGKVNFQDAFLAVNAEGYTASVSLLPGFRYYIYQGDKLEVSEGISFIRN